MKGFIKKLIVLCVTCCLSFCACGAEQQTAEQETVETKEETVEVEAKPIVPTGATKITDQTMAETYYNIVDTGAYLAFNDGEKTEIYIYYVIQNITTEYILSNLKYTFDIYSKTTNNLIASDVAEINTLAPGETGIGVARIYGNTSDLKGTKSNVTFNSMEYYPVEELKGFKQSDLTIADTGIDDSGYVSNVLYTHITNNSQSDVLLPTVKVLGIKDGDYVGYAYTAVADGIAPGTQQTIEIPTYDTFPTDCDDYLIFVDYSEIH